MKKALLTFKCEMFGSDEKFTVDTYFDFARDKSEVPDYAFEDKVFKKFDAALDAAKQQIRKLAE